MVSKFYGGQFNSWADVCSAFGDYNKPLELPEPDKVFAVYDIDGYEGDAVVVYQQDGEYYLVEGSHCSCYGLEDQFTAEKSSDTELRHLADRASYGVFHKCGAQIKEWLDG